MTPVASTTSFVVHQRVPSQRSVIVGFLPESEGKLVVVALKIPEKLKERIDKAAKKTGNNRTQTMLALMRHSLDLLEASEDSEEKTAKPQKSKGR